MKRHTAGIALAIILGTPIATGCSGEPPEPVSYNVEFIEFDPPEGTEIETTKRSDGSTSYTIDGAEDWEVTLNLVDAKGNVIGEYDAPLTLFAASLGVNPNQLTEDAVRQQFTFQTTPIVMGWFGIGPSSIEVIPKGGVGSTVSFTATKDTD